MSWGDMLRLAEIAPRVLASAEVGSYHKATDETLRRLALVLCVEPRMLIDAYNRWYEAGLAARREWIVAQRERDAAGESD